MSETGQAAQPAILMRYVNEANGGSNDVKPTKIVRRFHNVDVPLWRGRVHVDDVEGWVENLRILHFLNRWKDRSKGGDKTPTTEDLYEIMVEADKDEKSDSKPFHIERIANNIARNGVQEPVILFVNGDNKVRLWDGNRRFFGTKHIMRDEHFADVRSRAKWIPADVYLASGDAEFDEKVKHSVLTEMNFVEKDHIPWPAYVKAGQIFEKYNDLTGHDPFNGPLKKKVKTRLAEEYGLKGWRAADRWIKMYELAERFKEYQEEENHHPAVEVDLRIQEEFEYFDELSKAGVWGALQSDPDAQREVFNWLWDGKFKSWPDVRVVPQILNNSVARQIANRNDPDAVRNAIKQVYADDPGIRSDKRAAGDKIKQFAQWLDSFKREDFKGLDSETVRDLEGILRDVIAMLKGLHTEAPE